MSTNRAAEPHPHKNLARSGLPPFARPAAYKGTARLWCSSCRRSFHVAQGGPDPAGLCDRCREGGA